MHRSRPMSVAVLFVVLALALVGCSLFSTKQAAPQPSPTLSPSPLPTEPAAAPPAGSPGLASYYRQTLDWRPCADNAHNRCARLRVPLDYAKPRGRSLSLAVLKVPAGSPSHRVGSLVINPGGPGESGYDYASYSSAAFGSEITQAFDVVGFDPRGVQRSDPLKCASTAELDAYAAADPDPATAAARSRALAQTRQLGEGCLRESGALARHMSTEESARDMDILRAALGEQRLTYFGASYGTYLGTVYANLFAHRVGRMVLDGAIDPATSTQQTGLVQAHGFEVALRSYVKACVDRGSCFLGSSVDQGTRRIRAFLDSVQKKPLPGSGGRMLRIGNAVYGIWYPLYSRTLWGTLDTALQAGFGGNGGPLLALSDAYVNRGPHGYTANSTEAYLATSCLDRGDAPTAAQVQRDERKFVRASPTFGRGFDFADQACRVWPVRPSNRPHVMHAQGAPPILVIGTTRDPATPLVWARALARQLDSGVLVTRNGDGHTGYHAGNSCVDGTVESYLVSDKVPSATVHC
ncbi:MAG: alpha/beta hydrolase [Nocardioidaceae bacterium]